MLCPGGTVTSFHGYCWRSISIDIQDAPVLMKFNKENQMITLSFINKPNPCTIITRQNGDSVPCHQLLGLVCCCGFLIWWVPHILLFTWVTSTPNKTLPLGPSALSDRLANWWQNSHNRHEMGHNCICLWAYLWVMVKRAIQDVPRFFSRAMENWPGNSYNPKTLGRGD